MSKVVLSAIASVFTVIVSPLPLAVIVVLAVPLVMLMPLSAALPVVTSKLPLRLVPVRLPIKLVTTCLAAPKRVSREFSGRLVVLVVRVSSALLPLTVVAPLPVVIAAALSEPVTSP